MTSRKFLNNFYNKTKKRLILSLEEVIKLARSNFAHHREVFNEKVNLAASGVWMARQDHC